MRSACGETVRVRPRLYERFPKTLRYNVRTERTIVGELSFGPLTRGAAAGAQGRAIMASVLYMADARVPDVMRDVGDVPCERMLKRILFYTQRHSTQKAASTHRRVDRTGRHRRSAVRGCAERQAEGRAAAAPRARSTEIWPFRLETYPSSKHASRNQAERRRVVR